MWFLTLNCLTSKVGMVLLETADEISEHMGISALSDTSLHKVLVIYAFCYLCLCEFTDVQHTISVKESNLIIETHLVLNREFHLETLTLLTPNWRKNNVWSTRLYGDIGYSDALYV